MSLVDYTKADHSNNAERYGAIMTCRQPFAQ